MSENKEQAPEKAVEEPKKISEDEELEKEVTDAIKKLPLEERVQIIALNYHLEQKKKLDK